MKTSVLIVEDEPAIADYIQFMLKGMGYDVPRCVTNFHDAVKAIEESNPDILLIDISIKGDRDGVELGLHVRRSNDRPLIFVTSHTDQATLERAKEVKPDGYLTKPFREHDIHIAIEMALNNFSHGPGTKKNEGEIFLKDCIFIRGNKSFIKLYFHEIEWLKADGNYTEIHTINQKHIVRNNLNDVEKFLPQDAFLRIHRSYTIRLNAIKAINAQSVTLASAEIPISRKMHSWLLNNFNLLSS